MAAVMRGAVEHTHTHIRRHRDTETQRHIQTNTHTHTHTPVGPLASMAAVMRGTSYENRSSSDCVPTCASVSV